LYNTCSIGEGGAKDIFALGEYGLRKRGQVIGCWVPGAAGSEKIFARAPWSAWCAVGKLPEIAGTDRATGGGNTRITGLDTDTDETLRWR